MPCLCSQCTVQKCDKKKNLAKRIIGKRSRNTGRYAEKKLLKLFQKWNLNVKQTISSGSLKKQVIDKIQDPDMFVGDLIVTIQGKQLRVENKLRQYKVFKKYYENTENNVILIPNLCYIISENQLYNILTGEQTEITIKKMQDNKHKILRSFFQQDNADIVSIISPQITSRRYYPFLFCITIQTYKKLLMKEVGIND